MNYQFTGNKDVDYKIMMSLDDEDLFQFCKVENNYIRSICDNDNFWYRRTIQKFGNDIAKPINDTWRQYYNHRYNNHRTIVMDNGIKITVELDRNSPIFLESMNTVKNGYERTYKREYELKPEPEIRKIIGDMINKGIVNKGLHVMGGGFWIIDSHIFDPTSPITVLVKRDKILFVWNNDFLGDATRDKYYMEIGNDNKGNRNFKKVYLPQFEDLANLDNRYIFIPSLRVSGIPEDIVNYFLSIGVLQSDIGAHINVAYTIDNIKTDMKGRYTNELNQSIMTGVFALPTTN